MSNRKELTALKNLLSEADLILSTTKLPENRTPRCRELLASALALTDDLLSQSKPSVAAVTLGRKGGFHAKWDEAIADAKHRIAKLHFSIRIFRARKQAGDPFPPVELGRQRRKQQQKT